MKTKSEKKSRYNMKEKKMGGKIKVHVMMRREHDKETTETLSLPICSARFHYAKVL